MLLSLPNELLYHIRSNLANNSDLASLILTNHHLSVLLTPILHIRATEDKAGFCALHWAAMHGHVTLVNLLINTGCNLEVGTAIKKRTPLQLAAWNGVHEIIDILVANGANINTRDSDGDTALHLAVLAGRLPTVKSLLDNGADIHAAGVRGDRPLHYAVGDSRPVDVDILQLLLASGAEVDCKNDVGMTPLYQAAELGNEPMIEILLANGADVGQLNIYGETPLPIATLARLVAPLKDRRET